MAKTRVPKKQIIQDTSNSIKSIDNFKRASFPMRVINSFKQLLNQLNLL
jgi:hypothetical protein